MTQIILLRSFIYVTTRCAINLFLRQRGPIFLGPLLKSVPPFHVWTPKCNIVFKKCNPLVFFGPAAAKSWGRASIIPRHTGVKSLTLKLFPYYSKLLFRYDL